MPRHGAGNLAGGLRFFLPRRLTDFEYFPNSAADDEDYRKIAGPYQRDMDFAFFAVNFGYSKADYEALTLRERAFIYKAWEDKLVSDTTLMYNAVFTAAYNAGRPKRRPALKLWSRGRVRKADTEAASRDMGLIQEIEQKEGDPWIEMVYQANGLHVPTKGGAVHG